LSYQYLPAVLKTQLEFTIRETLSPHVDELVVAGITQSRGSKSDKRDAYGLAEKLRVGNLDKYVFKSPRQFTMLREFSRTHMTLAQSGNPPALPGDCPSLTFSETDMENSLP
jgi:hypothetical protein